MTNDPNRDYSKGDILLKFVQAAAGGTTTPFDVKAEAGYVLEYNVQGSNRQDIS